MSSKSANIDLSTLRDVYSAWVGFADKNDGERKAFTKLTNDQRKVVEAVVGILEHNKEALEGIRPSAPLIITKDEASLLKGVSVKTIFGEAAEQVILDPKRILARIDDSFRSIHPTGKGLNVLERYHNPVYLTNLQNLQELRPKLQAAFREIKTKPAPRTVPKQGEVGKAISKEQEAIFEVFEEWGKGLKNPKDRQLAQAALASLKKEFLPAYYGIGAHNVDEALNIFSSHLNKVVAEAYLKADKQTLSRTGLSSDKAILKPVSKGFEKALEHLAPLKTERDVIGNRVMKSLEEGHLSKVDIQREIETHREKVKELDDGLIYLLAELEPHLANRDVAALYGKIQLARVNLQRELLQSSHELEDLLDTDPKEFQGYIEDVAARISKGASVAEAVRDENIKRAVSIDSVENVEAEAASIERLGMVWLKYAADLGDGPSAVEAARLAMVYSPADGKDFVYRSREIEGYLGTAIKQKAPGAQEAKGDYLRIQYERVKAQSASPNAEQLRQLDIYSQTAITAYQKAGRDEGLVGLQRLYQAGSLKAGEAMVPLLKKLVAGKNPNPDYVKMLGMLRDAGVKGTEEKTKPETKKPASVAASEEAAPKKPSSWNIFGRSHLAEPSRAYFPGLRAFFAGLFTRQSKVERLPDWGYGATQTSKPLGRNDSAKEMQHVASFPGDPEDELLAPDSDDDELLNDLRASTDTKDPS